MVTGTINRELAVELLRVSNELCRIYGMVDDLIGRVDVIVGTARPPEVADDGVFWDPFFAEVAAKEFQAQWQAAETEREENPVVRFKANGGLRGVVRRLDAA